MVDKIVQFYDNELSDKKLVLSHMKFWKPFLILMCMSLSVIVFVFQLSAGSQIVLYFTLIGILGYLFNRKAKMVLRTQYNFEQNSFLWGGQEIEDYKVSRLREFLLQFQNPFPTSKLEKIIDYLRKESERNKISSIFLPGAFIALFIPLWAQYLSWIFRQDVTFNQATRIFFGISLIIIFSTFFISVFKVIISDILFGKASKLNHLIEKLENIIFDPSSSDKGIQDKFDNDKHQESKKLVNGVIKRKLVKRRTSLRMRE